MNDDFNFAVIDPANVGPLTHQTDDNRYASSSSTLFDEKVTEKPKASFCSADLNPWRLPGILDTNSTADQSQTRAKSHGHTALATSDLALDTLNMLHDTPAYAFADNAAESSRLNLPRNLQLINGSFPVCVPHEGNANPFYSQAGKLAELQENRLPIPSTKPVLAASRLSVLERIENMVLPYLPKESAQSPPSRKDNETPSLTGRIGYRLAKHSYYVLKHWLLKVLWKSFCSVLVFLFARKFRKSALKFLNRVDIWMEEKSWGTRDPATGCFKVVSTDPTSSMLQRLSTLTYTLSSPLVQKLLK